MFESFNFPSGYADDDVIAGIVQPAMLPSSRESTVAGTIGSASSENPHFAAESAAATAIGDEPAAILAKACEWARNEEHAFVTIDHVLFALVSRKSASSALNAAGVEAVAALDEELVALVHRLPVTSLPRGQLPEMENAVVALLHHAQGHARHDGRSTWDTTDLLAALRNAMQRQEFVTPGMLALQKHWPAAANDKSCLDLISQIRETQVSQYDLTIAAVSRLLQPIARHDDQERTGAILATAEQRIVQLLLQMRDMQIHQTEAFANGISHHLNTISEKVASLTNELQSPRRKTLLQRAVPHICTLAVAGFAAAAVAVGVWPAAT